MYIVFPVYGNKKFAELIRDRLVELGYKRHTSVQIDNAVEDKFGGLSISKNNKYAYFTSGLNHPNIPNHEMGDFEKLFESTYYKFREPIIVPLGEYKAEVTDTIKIG